MEIPKRSRSYTYDSFGNLTGVYENNVEKQHYLFGATNRLEESGNDQGDVARYSYNGLGYRVGEQTGRRNPLQPSVEGMAPSLDPVRPLRTQTMEPTGQVDYLLDLTRGYHNLLGRTKEGSTERFLWDGAIVGMEEESAGMQYYFADELGSPLRLVDEAGRETAFYGYDEFGQDLYQDQGQTQPFGYTGYQKDRVSGTYFAQAREYAPESGRFLSEDLVKGFIISPITLNLYSYCLNNPQKYVDLDGKIVFTLKGALNATLLFGVGIDIDVLMDDNFNIALQWSYYVPGVNDTKSFGCFDVGAAAQLQVMNVDTVYDLEGKTSYMGASAGGGLYLGLDAVTQESIADMTDEEIEGIQGQLGYGVGIDVHLTESYTSTIASAGIFADNRNKVECDN